MTLTSPERVFVICEAGVTNYGDMELARRQVDVAADSGCDAVKFQAWKTESLVSRRVADRLSEELGHNWYDRMAARELSSADLRELSERTVARGLVFFATPHDEASLAFLVDDLDVPCLKVGSGEANNWQFLRRVGATGKPVLIAFGLQTDEEARRAVDLLREAGAPEVIAFHTVSVYPTPYEIANVRRIPELQEKLDVPIGISDHTVGWHVPLAAVALGAQSVEKHLTFDKRDPRSLDNPGALEPDEFPSMVSQIRDLELALAPPAPAPDLMAASRDWALQAVVAASDLPEGRVLEAEDVAFKRPARGGVPASEVDALLGRRLLRAVEADEQIRLEDVAQ